jgi:3-oxosteroid 1-dehydrogenase
VSDPQEVDFICLGAGIGGMAAAIKAHDLGLSTIVLEKSDQLGGVAAYSSGQLWCAGNHLAVAAGIEDSWEEGYTYLQWLGDGTSDLDMLRTFALTAPEAFEYFEREAGVRWCLLDLADNYFPEAPGAKPTGRFVELEPIMGGALPAELRGIVRHSPTSLYSNDEVYFKMGGHPHRATWDVELADRRREQDIRYQGSALAAYFVLAVHERGIPMLTNVDVTEVLVDAGAVVGVAARVDGEERRFLASKGVLVAMGGYDWNEELVLKYDKRDEVGSRAPRSVTGDHFALLEELAPAVHTVERGTGLGFVEPAEMDELGKKRWQPFYTGWPHTIVVDESGRRFGAESNPGGSGGPAADGIVSRIFDLKTGEPRHWPCWAIFDSQYRSKYAIGRANPRDDLPDCFVSSDSLADELGIDPDALVQTVQRFNVHAREGRDPEFGRGENVWSRSQFGDPWMEPNANLGTVESPPYYGVRLQLVAVALTRAGLLTDGRARVLNEGGDVIPNLYAVGNSMAWRDLGRNYHSGTANTRGMTWGYIAAAHAAGAEVGPRPLANVG